MSAERLGAVVWFLVLQMAAASVLRQATIRPTKEIVVLDDVKKEPLYHARQVHSGRVGRVVREELSSQNGFGLGAAGAGGRAPGGSPTQGAVPPMGLNTPMQRGNGGMNAPMNSPANMPPFMANANAGFVTNIGPGMNKGTAPNAMPKNKQNMNTNGGFNMAQQAGGLVEESLDSQTAGGQGFGDQFSGQAGAQGFGGQGMGMGENGAAQTELNAPMQPQVGGNYQKIQEGQGAAAVVMPQYYEGHHHGGWYGPHEHPEHYDYSDWHHHHDDHHHGDHHHDDDCEHDHYRHYY